MKWRGGICNFTFKHASSLTTSIDKISSWRSRPSRLGSVMVRTAASHVAIGATLTVMSSPTLAAELTELDG